MNRGYEPSRVVHLRNLPEDIDMNDVMELGRPFGPVISALRIKETQVRQLLMCPTFICDLNAFNDIHSYCLHQYYKRHTSHLVSNCYVVMLLK